MLMPPRMKRATALAMLLLIGALPACSTQAATSCTFNEDCAQPHEYCSLQTDLCTPYECIEDDDCDKKERCNIITNTCFVPIKPDMSMMPDIPKDMPGDMKGDMPTDMPGEDLGAPDMPEISQPDQNQDTARPEVLSISPPPGSSLTAGGEGQGSITITFDEALDPLSVSAFSIGFFDEEGNDLAAEVRHDTATHVVTVTPGEVTSSTRLYRLVVSDIVRDVAGNTLERDRTFLFYPEFTRDEELHTLATRWAPIIHQELPLDLGIWRHDVPSLVNFDGDWNASNNLEQLASIAPGDYKAAVYYSVVSTPSHHYITYMLYYPSRTIVDEGMMDTHHEHDFTGVMLVIERASDSLLLVEGLRIQENTDLIIAFMNQDRDVDLPGQGRIRGRFKEEELIDGTRYPLYVPARRHEACNWNDPEVLPPFDVCVHPTREFRANFTGVVMTVAAQGQGIEDATQTGSTYAMTYALHPFEETFWVRRDLIGSTSLYGRGFSYSPEGDRPTGPAPDGMLYLPQSLASRDASSLGKSPFTWLTQPARRNDGQWLIDPTWTVRQRYSVPQTPVWSYDYCYNTPLAIDRRADDVCITPPTMP